MKPPTFAYFAPRTLEDAERLIGQHTEDGKLLAGGQSLVPILNFRLASPAVIVDLNRVKGLEGVTIAPDGGLIVRSMTRHRTLERSELVARSNPLLASAMPHIAHMQIRNRGTIGGSLAHADPAAELPAIVLACDADIMLASTNGTRAVPASKFFQGVFTTALGPDEILTEVRFPRWPAGRRSGFQEVSRRHGDFALAGTALWLEEDAGSGGRCTDARIVIFGAADVPVRVPLAERVLKGAVPDDAVRREAADAAAASLSPRSDLHASAEYRRDAARALVRRALEQALDYDPGESGAR